MTKSAKKGAAAGRTHGKGRSAGHDRPTDGIAVSADNESAEAIDLETDDPEVLDEGDGEDPSEVKAEAKADTGDADEATNAGEHPADLPVPARASTPARARPSKGAALDRVDSLTAYMAELRHHAPISREAEHSLAMRWSSDGDVEAARQLVLANLRLVVKIAMEYRRAWTNTLDLIQEGNVGLMEAVQRFDPYKGVKLSSYAVYWIRAYILKYILDNMRSVRMGTTRAQRKLFFRLNKEKRELERLGYEAEPKLIAARLDVGEDDVIEMEARLARPDLSMDAPVRHQDGDGSATHGDFFAAGGPDAESLVGDNELSSVFHEKIEEFAEDLSERDEQILRERVLAEEPRTLADMGEEFGISRERVRQLEARLVNRLRESLRESMVDFDYYAADDANE